MLEADPITHVWVNHDPAIEQLTLSGKILDTTPEHPFFTAERGWVAAGDLQPGEHVRRLDGSWGVVEQLRVEVRPVVMYNLTVARAHTFFVGDEGWLVHNACGDGPRMRHYTSRSGSNGIEVSNTIKANAKQWESGCVYCERASGKPLSPRDAEKYYQLNRGHGRDYIEFDTFPGEARSVTNPRTGRTEWVVDGNIDLQGRNARMTRR